MVTLEFRKRFARRVSWRGGTAEHAGKPLRPGPGATFWVRGHFRCSVSFVLRGFALLLQPLTLNLVSGLVVQV